MMNCKKEYTGFDMPAITDLGTHGEMNYLLNFLEEAIDRIISNETSVAEVKLNIVLAQEQLAEQLPELLQEHFKGTF